MRILNMYLILWILLIQISLRSCEEDVVNSYGQVAFYTNAQFLLNCGEFDVTISIDGSIAGVLKQPFLPVDSIPSCKVIDSLTLLSLQKVAGLYNYTADFYCSGNMQWNGIIDVKKDSCTIIFLDVTQL